jgi:ribosomal protein S18 acetylase RimI-like enzyme
MSARCDALMRVQLELAVGDAKLQFARDAFDSDSLGLEIGRVTVAGASSQTSYQQLFRRLADEADDLGYDQILRRIEEDDREESIALQRTGFELVDVGLTFARPPRASDLHSERFAVREAEEADVEVIERELVGEPWGSRFERDPAYEPDRVRDVKRRWLWNSLGSRADAFLVAADGEEVAGFVTCILAERRTGVIELIATIPAHRRRGVASLLVRKALAWFEGCADSVTVRCQGSNRAAARLYERSGFLFETTDLTFRMPVRHVGLRDTQEPSWNASS